MSTYFVGFDGSDPSRSAIRWALARAEADKSPVVLVHVVDDEWGLLGPDYAREAERRAGSLPAQEVIAAKTHAGVDIGALVLHGSPAWTLAAVPTSDDVLVVGTHKTGSLHGRVLGSRSVQIASAAAGTVAVVPESTVASHPRPVTQSVIGSVTHDVLMNINVPVLIARSA